jgi:hypothetical protein
MRYSKDTHGHYSKNKQVYGIREEDAEGLPLATAETEGGNYLYLLLVPPNEYDPLPGTDFGLARIPDWAFVVLPVIGILLVALLLLVR